MPATTGTSFGGRIGLKTCERVSSNTRRCEWLLCVFLQARYGPVGQEPIASLSPGGPPLPSETPGSTGGGSADDDQRQGRRLTARLQRICGPRPPHSQV